MVRAGHPTRHSLRFVGVLPAPCCSVAGKATLEASDLGPSLQALKERLMSKNVVSTM